ncbi:hypothetical protein Gorai_014751 [Gossypium raimondii]|uniref:Uncharacterized protein n=1 Tax=Gossypium raimondii TaxID=29730 RepID=A0A7J8P3U1_GOSRA|nr:hypothetical protein [Gossypium raimondii]
MASLFLSTSASTTLGASIQNMGVAYLLPSSANKWVASFP